MRAYLKKSPFPLSLDRADDWDHFDALEDVGVLVIPLLEPVDLSGRHENLFRMFTNTRTSGQYLLLNKERYAKV